MGFAYFKFVVPTPEAACYIVVDRTASTSSDSARQALQETAMNALEGCAEIGAVATIAWFDQAGPELESTEEYKLYQPGGLGAESLEAAQAQVAEVFTVEVGDERGSDVLTAIRDAAEGIRQSGAANGVSDLHLIVLSDGTQMSGGVTMASFTEDTDTASEVQKATDLGLIPQLDGVSVSFYGASTRSSIDGQDLQPWYVQKRKQFWSAAIDAAGGSRCVWSPAEAEHVPGECGSWS